MWTKSIHLSSFPNALLCKTQRSKSIQYIWCDTNFSSVTLLVCTWHDTSLSESFYIWLTGSVALSKKKKGILPSFVHYHLFYPLCTVLASAISQYTTLLLFSSIHNKCSQLDFLSTSSLFSIILCPLHSFSVYKVLLPSFIVLCCSCYHHVSM